MKQDRGSATKLFDKLNTPQAVAVVFVLVLIVIAVLYLLRFAVLVDNGAPTGEIAAGEPIVGEFVGRASTLDAYVALLAEEGSTAGETRITVSVSNSPNGQLDERFDGTATGNRADLVSDSGEVRLQATLNKQGAHGGIESPGSGSLARFEATETTGSNPSGLYELTLDAYGNLSGSSWSGKRLEAEAVERSGFLFFAGAITLPSGEKVPWVTFDAEQRNLRTPNPGEFRIIISEDGTARGSSASL